MSLKVCLILSLMRNVGFLISNRTIVIRVIAYAYLTHTFVIMLSFELRGERLSVLVYDLAGHYNN